uniref:Putative clathrin assembly protein At4g40080 n=1 Tax=Rhizophora mucronata TaxID=61149 RepID=A0A2P2J3S3_RHIMU
MTNLRNIIGIIKDKASQSKATIVSNPKTLSHHLSLLRATTHDPSSPPSPKHIATFLSFGHSSRATAAAAIESLMDRLQSTRDASVAIKCLITVHRIIRQGSFILQDQLSVYPSTGGRNYLKLSDFRDNSTPLTWELSSWVRWYARYLEHLLSTSRVLGCFVCSSSSTADKDKEEEKVSAVMNPQLLKEIGSLVGLLEEICQSPDGNNDNDNNNNRNRNNLADEIMDLVCGDYMSAINSILIRVDEFKQRLSCLSFGDSVELGCVLKRLENCKDRILELSGGKKELIESLWCLVSEIESKVKGYREDGRLLHSWGMGSDRGSESARFWNRTLSYEDNSLRFSSARFGLSHERKAFPICRNC